MKTRLTDEEYADFAQRLSIYGISQSEFLWQAITNVTIRPVITVSSINNELLSAVGKLIRRIWKNRRQPKSDCPIPQRE